MNVEANQRAIISAALIKGHAITHEMLREVLERVEERIADLSTEEAIARYQEHLKTKRRSTLEGFQDILAKFLTHFAGRNFPEIYTKDIRLFVDHNWKGCKQSTITWRVNQLSSLFEWCNKSLAEEGKPTFFNPCKLIESKRAEVTRPALIEESAIGKILSETNDEESWIAVAVMATGGLRISELLKLGMEVVSEDGRVLQLLDTKSGKKVETVVVPDWVGAKLVDFLEAKGRYPFLGGTDDLWAKIENKRKVLGNTIKRAGKRAGITISPHKLRAFCATFWTRKEDAGMVDYVLRHSGSPTMSSLDSRYIARLTEEEAMIRQDEQMGRRLFI